MKPFFIGLSGLSGAGKSTLAEHLERQGGIKRFRFDAYYKTLEDCPKLADGRPHWDLPESLYLDEVFEDLQDLKEGQDIYLPLYDRASNARTGRVLYQPAPIIFVEGMQLFADERLRNLFDLRLWLEVDEQTAIARRLSRQPNYNLEYHWNIAMPAQRATVLPMRAHAHAIIDGTATVSDMTRCADSIIQKFLGM